MKRIKREKGITLVALIITIVVLLILAGVAIATVRDSDIIGYANQAKTSYEEGKEIEETRLKEYEQLLKNLNSKNTSRLYRLKYINADNEVVEENQSVVLNSDNTMQQYDGGNLEVDAVIEYMDNTWTVTNNNYNITKIVSVKVDGTVIAMAGITEDETKLYATSGTNGIDETAKTITVMDNTWYEFVDNIDKENKWHIRGLTGAITDAIYKAEFPGAGKMELSLYKNGGAKLTLGESSEELDNEGVIEAIENEEIIILSKDTIIINETLGIENSKFKFIKDGTAAQWMEDDGDTPLLTLYIGESDLKPLSSYLYYVPEISESFGGTSENLGGIFIDTDYSGELWLIGTEFKQDIGLPFGTVLVGPGEITKSDGTTEFKDRCVNIVLGALAGESSGTVIKLGYLTEDDQLYITETNEAVPNRRLFADTVQFTQIYDTEETNELNMTKCYGLIQDEGSTTTGVYHTMIRYKDKYDCAVFTPAKYKIEDGVIYLETINDSGIGTGKYEAMPSTAKLRQ